MDNVVAIFTVIGVAIVILTFLGTAVVFLRGSKDKGTITTLQNYANALEHRVEQLEASEKSHLARIEALEGANRVLTDTVTSRADIAELAGVIHHHNQFVAEWTERIDKWTKDIDEWRREVIGAWVQEISQAMSRRQP